jgi:hypothetical protein
MLNKKFNNIGYKIIEECSLNFGNKIVINSRYCKKCKKQFTYECSNNLLKEYRKLEGKNPDISLCDNCADK